MTIKTSMIKNDKNWNQAIESTANDQVLSKKE